MIVWDGKQGAFAVRRFQRCRRQSFERRAGIAVTAIRFRRSGRGAHLDNRGRGATLHDGRDWGDGGQWGGDSGIDSPGTVKGVGSGTVALPGKIKIDVGLSGQDRPFVTLEIVRSHMRMQVAPVAVGDGRVVATFIGRIAMVADGTNV